MLDDTHATGGVEKTPVVTLAQKITLQAGLAKLAQVIEAQTSAQATRMAQQHTANGKLHTLCKARLLQTRPADRCCSLCIFVCRFASRSSSFASRFASRSAFTSCAAPYAHTQVRE